MPTRVLIVCLTGVPMAFGVLFLSWNEHPNQTAQACCSWAGLRLRLRF